MTYSVLEEIWIKILVKSVLKLNVTFLPVDFIAERNARTLYQLYFILAR